LLRQLLVELEGLMKDARAAVDLVARD
jgi:hypothetical protein